MEDLLNALADYLLQSGFHDPYSNFYEMNQGEHTLDDLRRQIQAALEAGELNDFMDMDSDQLQELMDKLQSEGKMEQLVDQLIQRMEQEGFISIDKPFEPNTQPSTAAGQTGDAQGQVKFEVTDKSLDFLGYRTLRDLLGSLGKANFGRHDTRDLATGVETFWRGETIRIWRHAEPRHHGYALQRDTTRRIAGAVEHRVLRPAGASV